MNFTDPELRLMPISGGGFEPCYNAQACVDQDSCLLVESHVTQQPNDKQEIKPALTNLGTLPEELGQVLHLAANTGYCRSTNAEACEQEKIIPLLACGRETHHPSPEARFADAGKAPATTASTVTRMRHRLKTAEGKAIYAKRKFTVEPVFGVIKQVMGFRQFLLRGLDAGWYGLQFEATPCLGRIDLPEGKSNGRQWKKRPINGAFEGTIIIVMRNSRIQP